MVQRLFQYNNDHVPPYVRVVRDWLGNSWCGRKFLVCRVVPHTPFTGSICWTMVLNLLILLYEWECDLSIRINLRLRQETLLKGESNEKHRGLNRESSKRNE